MSIGAVQTSASMQNNVNATPNPKEAPHLMNQNILFVSVINTTQRISDAKLVGKPKEPSHPRKKRGRKPTDKSKFYCYQCDTTSTPEWRRGPQGKNTLCNACGLFYSSFNKKDKKRDKSDHFSFILNPFSQKITKCHPRKAKNNNQESASHNASIKNLLN